MGNSTSRVVGCFVPSGNGKDGGIDLDFLEPLDEGLGHSFCYVRPGIVDSPAITPSNSERFTLDSSTFDSETHSGSFRQEIVEDPLGLQRLPNKNFSETTFKTISGASVSANASTARTGNLNLLFSGDAQEPAASFESTASFAAIPLQPLPRGPGPLNGFMSGPLERGFASGPLERGAGYMSGPLEKGVFMSGPLDTTDRSNFSAPLAYGRRRAGFGRLMRSMSRPMKSALSRTFTRPLSGTGWMQRFFVQPMTQFAWHPKEARFHPDAQRNCIDVGPSENDYSNTRNLQWAHGKAGEDRVHVVLSEEQGWLFVGIYDGFSGPDAPDFLMSYLYRAINKELEGLLWDYDEKPGNNLNTCDLEKHGTGTCEDRVKEEGLTSLSCNDSLEDGDERQRRSKIEKGVGNESVKAEEILEIKGEDIDNSTGTRHAGQVCFADLNAKNAGTVGPADLPENKVCLIPESSFSLQGRKSKRLYELLQMELMDDCDAKASLSISEFGRSRTASWGSQPNIGEDFRARESLPTSQLSEDERSTKEGSSHFEEDLNLRENEGTAGEEYRDSKTRNSAPFSVPGNKQMMKRSLMGSKLRKMYKKQKSLRKKLFPWNYDWHREQARVDEKIVESSLIIRRCKSGPVDHEAVLKAMSRALEATEEAYMEMVERTLDKNPELALMGSCVLVMLMKDQDVYVMNLGDSRVILAQERLNDRHIGPNLTRSRESLVRVELDRISEESPMHNPNLRVCKDNKNREISIYGLKMRAVQLSTDHSTSVQEEVARIKAEHVDDAQAVFNDRVKGQLKVTRAFGAGFLKKPNFNEALLEMFRIVYIGSSPYVSCIPSVCHHRLCSNDRFLVLSSDGLYQYFSNEEVVSHVAWFMENAPEGDPAQYLIAELLFRAAKKNGMDFHELLDIPHGDRRKYHDDVSVMVISLEGRIWRSSG